jgi:predicted HTH transcriptional regulator
VRNPLTGRAKDGGSIEKGEDNRGPMVRVAVYDNLSSLPRVHELTGRDYQDFVTLMADKTYELSHSKGGQIPFTVIREVVENLVHAYFEEAVITILDDGNTIRVSDQGPGIRDKEAAFSPGFSTATREMKQVIRGVGSGLPVAREAIEMAGGKITVEDNLSRGAVVTLSLAPLSSEPAVAAEPVVSEPELPAADLTDRQKRVLFLVAELGALGPSKIANELSISLSSAHRDLVALEALGLIDMTSHGKRALSALGVDYLEHMEG